MTCWNFACIAFVLGSGLAGCLADADPGPAASPGSFPPEGHPVVAVQPGTWELLELQIEGSGGFEAADEFRTRADVEQGNGPIRCAGVILPTDHGGWLGRVASTEGETTVAATVAGEQVGLTGRLISAGSDGGFSLGTGSGLDLLAVHVAQGDLASRLEVRPDEESTLHRRASGRAYCDSQFRSFSVGQETRLGPNLDAEDLRWTAELSQGAIVRIETSGVRFEGSVVWPGGSVAVAGDRTASVDQVICIHGAGELEVSVEQAVADWYGRWDFSMLVLDIAPPPGCPSKWRSADDPLW